MHILIGQLRQHVDMRLQRVLHLHPRRLAVPPERPDRSVLEFQSHLKGVHPHQLAFHLRPRLRRQRHQRRLGAPRRPEATPAHHPGYPRILQHLRIRQPRRNPPQITRHRMAARALLPEKLLAFPRVTHQNRRRRHLARRLPLPANRVHHAAHISRHRLGVLRAHRNRRHPAPRQRPLDHRNNQLARPVRQRQLRPQQVRPPHVATPQIRSVARPARYPVHLLAPRNLHRIPRRPLLPRHKPAASLRQHRRRQHPASYQHAQTRSPKDHIDSHCIQRGPPLPPP